MQPIKEVLVVGSGSAGLLAALSLKRKLPELNVRIVRSKEIGVIGVGEGTTPNFPRFIFEYLGISRKYFYENAKPTWKLGIRFLWGPRGEFEYGFAQQLDAHWTNLPKPNGFYCDDDFTNTNLPAALMQAGKVFERQADGSPDVQPWHAFHMENIHLVETLENVAINSGIPIIEGVVSGVTKGENGIKSVLLEDGSELTADLFIDSTGFRSELLGKALGEPFHSFEKHLFCDRAVVGGWERGADEPIMPYTTAEAMDAGWSWKIEHEHHINRGYVYSSAFISDEDARAEFLAKNPKANKNGRVIQFRSGHYRRAWVDNVVAVGNSCGFVEPLEATALMIVCSECQNLCDFLAHSSLKPTPTFKNLFNGAMTKVWEEVRDFLALHYYLNTQADTPFWKHCVANTDVSGMKDLLEFYHENGPTGFGRHTLRTGSDTDFGMEGYLVMLVGNKAPYQARHNATDAEKQIWQNIKDMHAQKAATGLTVKEALQYVHHPGWKWNAG